MYAESLGRELGLYQDPYSYYGYLQNALWRSVRLVTDTGLHSKGWTRTQAIDYMVDNSAMTRADAEARWTATWPSPVRRLRTRWAR